MRIERANPAVAKGWFIGPWNSNLAVSIGYANEGVDEPHFHSVISEIYLVARGTSIVRVEKDSISLAEGDVLILEPGEAHTFLESSPDYFHFVLHTSGLAGEKALAEKYITSRERLGLD